MTNNLNKIFIFLILLGVFLVLSSQAVFADGTETLGTPSIDISTGTGVIASGTGLITQLGTIDIIIPGSVDVKQVLLYWEGQHTSPEGDDTILVNDIEVTGILIGGPTSCFSNVMTSSYRADITKIKRLSLKKGLNTFQISGADFDFANNGAGILVIIDDGTPQKDIQLLDGNDFAFSEFGPTLDTTVPQTFGFAPAITDRQADLSMFFSSVAGTTSGGEFRPSSIKITTDMGTEVYFDNYLDSNDGQEWDTLKLTVDIPAQATQLTVQALSEYQISNDDNPASFVWTAAALSIPYEISPAKGRMTGGGSVFTGDNARVTLGFEIHCDLSKPNNLQVNWPDGNKFHMLELTSAICTDDPKINPKPPVAPLDTFTGVGTGRFNGVEGATIYFTFVDKGEPGKSDTAWIQILDNGEQEVLNVYGSMKYGNLQAHK
ncbi:MAG: hypothetical protein K8R17_10435 [Methanosarcinales archaeon]|nr:hypothetical protein [Methanosarcinales archaeon]